MTSLYSSLTNFAIPKSKHKLERHQFDKQAVQSIRKLEQHGFEAFIVGGAIRDLLCNIEPKDFDIVTNAKPEEIKSIFKNSQIIGRRFKLVHLHFGRNILEIATFRAHHTIENIEDQAGSQSRFARHGLLVRDNIYGTIQEDAERRDFSINALYYSPTTESIYDFCNAFNDIKHKRIRILGDVKQRFQEDPVRMLRAHRFASKLQFQIEEEMLCAIHEHAHLLRHVSNARLFDESIKLFHNTYALPLITELQKGPLFKILYPGFNQHNLDWPQDMLEAALINTQERIVAGKPVTIAFIYAVILWPSFVSSFPIEHLQNRDFQKLGTKALSLMRQQSQLTLIPKRHAFAIKDIWEYQVRLEQRIPAKVTWLTHQTRFRAAFDFLILREQSKQINNSPRLSEWWEEFQFADNNKQNNMIQQLPSNKSQFKSASKKRKFRQKRKT